MSNTDRLFIAAFFMATTTFQVILSLAIYWALKLYLDDIWKQNDKIKRKVRKLVKHRQSIKDCKFPEGYQGIQRAAQENRGDL